MRSRAYKRPINTFIIFGGKCIISSISLLSQFHYHRQERNIFNNQYHSLSSILWLLAVLLDCNSEWWLDTKENHIRSMKLTQIDKIVGWQLRQLMINGNYLCKTNAIKSKKLCLKTLTSNYILFITLWHYLFLSLVCDQKLWTKLPFTPSNLTAMCNLCSCVYLKGFLHVHKNTNCIYDAEYASEYLK